MAARAIYILHEVCTHAHTERERDYLQDQGIPSFFPMQAGRAGSFMYNVQDIMDFFHA